jgi:ADP-ribosylglycohydrolase
MACVLYGLVARQLLLGGQPRMALDSARIEFTGWYERSAEFPRFRQILEDDLVSVPESEIASTGYVLHTLHASLWCLMKSRSFEECVLRAVNLGGDTDTTGCVAGGLAGVHYGLNAIPRQWLHALARHEEVETLFNDFTLLVEPQS